CSRPRASERGVVGDGDAIISTVRDGFEEVCRVSALQVRGPHNVENAMAVAAVATLAGCPIATIGQGLRAFRGLEHVMEVVRVRRGAASIHDRDGTDGE